MRHRLSGRKLGRNPSHRRALLRNLVTSLLEHERLMTTVPKAKEIRPIAEKMITLGKRDTLHARRQVQTYLLSDSVAKKVFDTLAPRFGDRPGGYSRITRLRNRVGDGAEVAIIELLGSGLGETEKVDDQESQKKQKKQKKEAASEDASAANETATESAKDDA